MHAAEGMLPGACPAKAHDEEHLGVGGRRVLVSRKWTGKTLDRHRADRAEVVRQTLQAAGGERRDRRSPRSRRAALGWPAQVRVAVHGSATLDGRRCTGTSSLVRSPSGSAGAGSTRPPSLGQGQTPARSVIPIASPLRVGVRQSRVSEANHEVTRSALDGRSGHTNPRLSGGRNPWNSMQLFSLGEGRCRRYGGGAAEPVVDDVRTRFRPSLHRGRGRSATRASDGLASST